MELSTPWPSTAILEDLQTLSPDNFDDDQITTDVDKLSRSERAGKLLDQFDGIQNEESYSFDWYTHEKSIEIPIFDSLPSPPYQVDLKLASQDTYLDAAAINAGDYEREAALQQPLYDSPSLLAAPYDPLPSFYSSLSTAQPYEPTPAVVPLAQPAAPLANTVDVADYTFDVADYTFDEVKDECEPAAAAGSNSEWLKRETLTPPDSPKEEEIRRMLVDELETLFAGANQLTPLKSAAAKSCASPVAYSDEDSNCSGSVSPAPADDPEWTPPPRQSTRGVGQRASTSKSTLKSVSATSKSASTKRRATKPYSKPAAEERRERKKEQNKNAATRYRLKKKAEVEEVKLEEHQLEEDNTQLRKQVDELCREIRYLKSLMREVYRKKGLIK